MILPMLPTRLGSGRVAAADMLDAEARFGCAKTAVTLIYRDVLPQIPHPAVHMLYAAGPPGAGPIAHPSAGTVAHHHAPANRDRKSIRLPLPRPLGIMRVFTNAIS